MYLFVIKVVVISTRKVQTAAWCYCPRSWIYHHAPSLQSTVSASGTSCTASHRTPYFASTPAASRSTLGRSGVDAGHQVACGLVVWWRCDVGSQFSWCLLRSLDTRLPALPLTTSASYPAAVTWVSSAVWCHPVPVSL